jgi:hypothetical protein
VLTAQGCAWRVAFVDRVHEIFETEIAQDRLDAVIAGQSQQHVQAARTRLTPLGRHPNRSLQHVLGRRRPRDPAEHELIPYPIASHHGRIQCPGGDAPLTQQVPDLSLPRKGQ